MSLSTPRRRFTIHQMPRELRLEMFQFLEHKDWYRLCHHNRRTKRFLLGNTRWLAPARLRRLEFSDYSVVEYGASDITEEAYRRFGDDQEEDDAEDEEFLEGVLRTITEGAIPLFLLEDDDEEQIYAFFARDPGSCLEVALPVRPKTVRELKLVRFWLETIGETCFDSIYDDFRSNLPNPALLDLLYPKKKPTFRCADTMSLITIAGIPIGMGPFICARKLHINASSRVDLQFIFSLQHPPDAFEIIHWEDFEDPDPMYLIEACRQLRSGFHRFPGKIAVSYNRGNAAVPGPTHLDNAELISSSTPDEEWEVYEMANGQNPRIKFEVKMRNDIYGRYEQSISLLPSPNR